MSSLAVSLRWQTEANAKAAITNLYLMSRSVLFLCEFLLKTPTLSAIEKRQIESKHERFIILRNVCLRFLSGESCLECFCSTMTSHGLRQHLKFVAPYLSDEQKEIYNLVDSMGDQEDEGAYNVYNM